jgi:hypothetical protein
MMVWENMSVIGKTVEDIIGLVIKITNIVCS